MSTTFADELELECADGHPAVQMIVSSGGQRKATYQCPTCMRRVKATAGRRGGFDLDEVEKDGEGRDSQQQEKGDQG